MTPVERMREAAALICVEAGYDALDDNGCGRESYLWLRAAASAIRALPSITDDTLTDETPPDDAWREYTDDFDALSDIEVEEEVEMELEKLKKAESWLEAVRLWKAAGRPRNGKSD
jgi:hypothetical protein